MAIPESASGARLSWDADTSSDHAPFTTRQQLI
jgi:hypothetical protein